MLQPLMLRTIGIGSQTRDFDDRESMTDFVITDKRSLETRQGAVGRGIHWIYRFMDAAHAEHFVVPIEQARQIPGEHTDKYTEAVQELVAKKTAGVALTLTDKRAEPAPLDLGDILKASVAAAKARKDAK